MRVSKKKMTTSVILLLLAAIMLTGISLAWFVLSTSPEVENMDANLTTNQSLEIALDDGYADQAAVTAASQYDSSGTSLAGNIYTWGNYIDLSKAFASGTDGAKVYLSPSQYVASQKTLMYPTYDVDGRIKELKQYTTSRLDKNTGSGGVTAYGADSGTYAAFSLVFWMKSNVDSTNVKLASISDKKKRANSDSGSSATSSTVNSKEGGGSYLEISDAAGYGTKLTTYLDHLVIQFTVASDGGYTETTCYGKIDTTNRSGDKFPVKLCSDKEGNKTADSLVSLKENTAAKISMFVYMDGETVTNDSTLTDPIKNMSLGIQFTTDGDGLSGASGYDSDSSSYSTDGKLTN